MAAIAPTVAGVSAMTGSAEIMIGVSTVRAAPRHIV
jgi:hypothetical protein